MKGIIAAIRDLMKFIFNAVFIEFMKLSAVVTILALTVIFGVKSCEKYVDAHEVNIVRYSYDVRILDTAGTIVRSYDVQADYFDETKRYVEFTNYGGDMVLFISKDSTHNIVVRKEGVVNDEKNKSGN